eukprot:TRINITY_DN36395_c0_g2_i1.p1 TRINITY_DN36395_c0_g2~~TRINITY_DN36395_c0_g2_i1.p1  ORF type:complete len:689 (+),score=243.56 TRINITY_DN36395_c0_g2_i1:66-2132(+)
MQRAAHGFLLLGLLGSVASASQVTPIQKVIEMMEKMVAKGQKEMTAEQEQFKVFDVFCENNTVEKRRRIEEETERIEELSADIDKASSDIDQLTAEIAGHEADIASATDEKANATKVREEQAATYNLALQDYDDSVAAVIKALDVLKKLDHSRPQATSLLQLSEMAKSQKLTPKQASEFLDSFLRGTSSDAMKGSDTKQPALLQESEIPEIPEAAGYEFASGGVIDLLHKMEDQFKEERQQLKMDELKKKNVYSQLVITLDAELSNANTMKDKLSAEKNSILEQKVKDEAELSDVTAVKLEDIKYKKDLELTWKTKTAEFKSRQKLREEELEAVKKAIEIISGEQVSGNADKYLPSFAQRQSALAVLRSKTTAPNTKKIAEFLQQKAESLHSQQLSAVAMSLSRGDALSTVKTLIQSTIDNMKQKLAEETTKRAWCDEELKTNEETRSEKTDLVEKFTAEIETLEASIKKLKADIADLNKDVSDTKTAMASATSIRQQEKKENAATVADAKAAQKAVAQALTVLNEFYAKAAKATAFVQQPQGGGAPPPAAFEEGPYQGMGAESGGVVGMVEVIQSDFARLEAETTAAEEAAVREYKQFMDDSNEDVAGKEADVQHKTVRSESETQKMNEKKDDLGDAQKALDAATALYEELKPQCADAQASYEERKAQREQEIEDLTTALDALNGLR